MSTLATRVYLCYFCEKKNVCFTKRLLLCIVFPGSGHDLDLGRVRDLGHGPGHDLGLGHGCSHHYCSCCSCSCSRRDI